MVTMLKENKRYFPKRFALVLLLLTICALGYAFLTLILREKFPPARLVLHLLKILFALSVVSSKLSAESKCSWVFFILIFPYAAIPIYLIFYRTRLSKKEIKRLNEIYRQKPKSDIFASKMTLKCNANFAFLREIADFTNAKIYNNTFAKYIPDASLMLDMLQRDVRGAKRFIFLEFYTVASGSVFGELLSILIEKASLGVEVRIIYDEIGSLGRLPEDFSSLMKAYGIKAAAHASLGGTFPGALNNRNHRKIAVIDGEIAYTGGINLADEYVIPKTKFGNWKDCAVRIEGEGVCAITYTFLSDFSVISGEPQDFSKYYKYRKRICEGQALIFDDGPLPIYREKSSERIILSMLSASERYFTATSPYLVCETEMISAVRSAVRRGVKIKIIIPSKPDKFLPWILTRHYAALLSEAGAEIYSYTPGFLHSKIYSSDGKYLMCGSVNLDYRSLWHNFENGVLFAHHPVIAEAERDIEEILCSSVPYKKKKERLPMKILSAVMELFAPLF